MSPKAYGCKGHRDIVRAACVDAEASRLVLLFPFLRADRDLILLQTATIVTGGEDGRLCLWSP